MKVKKRKPVKRVFQQAGCVIPAKIRRIERHMTERLIDGEFRHKRDRVAAEQLRRLYEIRAGS